MVQPRDSNARHLRRALRALIRQRGGVMVMRLAQCGTLVRLECSLAAASAVALRVVTHPSGLAAVQQACAALRDECARVRRELHVIDGLQPEPSVPLHRAA